MQEIITEEQFNHIIENAEEISKVLEANNNLSAEQNAFFDIVTFSNAVATCNMMNPDVDLDALKKKFESISVRPIKESDQTNSRYDRVNNVIHLKESYLANESIRKLTLFGQIVNDMTYPGITEEHFSVVNKGVSEMLAQNMFGAISTDAADPISESYIDVQLLSSFVGVDVITDAYKTGNIQSLIESVINSELSELIELAEYAKITNNAQLKADVNEKVEKGFLDRNPELAKFIIRGKEEFDMMKHMVQDEVVIEETKGRSL